MKKVKFPYIEIKYNNNKEKAIPFVVTFHASLKSLGIILNKNDYLWMMKFKMFFFGTHGFIPKCKETL